MDPEVCNQFREKFNRFENGFNSYVKDKNHRIKQWEKLESTYNGYINNEILKLQVGEQKSG